MDHTFQTQRGLLNIGSADANLPHLNCCPGALRKAITCDAQTRNEGRCVGQQLPHAQLQVPASCSFSRLSMAYLAQYVGTSQGRHLGMSDDRETPSFADSAGEIHGLSPWWSVVGGLGGWLVGCSQSWVDDDWRMLSGVVWRHYTGYRFRRILPPPRKGAHAEMARDRSAIHACGTSPVTAAQAKGGGCALLCSGSVQSHRCTADRTRPAAAAERSIPSPPAGCLRPIRPAAVQCLACDASCAECVRDAPPHAVSARSARQTGRMDDLGRQRTSSRRFHVRKPCTNS